jgi:hypothetical protein
MLSTSSALPLEFSTPVVQVLRKCIRVEEAMTMRNGAVPLFALGRVLATPGAIQALAEAQVGPGDLLYRHVTGDWGDLCEEDKQQNDLALGNGTRVFSSYRLPTGEKLWIITEADRSATTFLLPLEY